MEKFVYPVFFQKNSEGYLITIPNINQSTQAGSFDEGIRVAEELLGLWIAILLDYEEPIPKSTGTMFRLPEKAFVYAVAANVDRYRDKYRNYYKGAGEDE